MIANIFKVTFLGLFILLSTLTSAQQAMQLSSIQSSKIIPMIQSIVSEGYRRAGLSIIIRELPAQRALIQANRGTLDGVLVRTRYIEKESTNLIRIPVLIYSQKTMVFGKESTMITSIKELPDVRAGFVAGYKHVEKIVNKNNSSAFASMHQLFKMLQFDRVDVAIIDLANGLFAIRDLNLKNITYLDKPLIELKLFHYVHKKHANLVPKLTQVFQEMQASGEIARISQSFIEKLRQSALQK